MMPPLRLTGPTLSGLLLVWCRPCCGRRGPNYSGVGRDFNCQINLPGIEKSVISKTKAFWGKLWTKLGIGTSCRSSGEISIWRRGLTPSLRNKITNSSHKTRVHDYFHNRSVHTWDTLSYAQCLRFFTAPPLGLWCPCWWEIENKRTAPLPWYSLTRLWPVLLISTKNSRRRREGIHDQWWYLTQSLCFVEGTRGQAGFLDVDEAVKVVELLNNRKRREHLSPAKPMRKVMLSVNRTSKFPQRSNTALSWSIVYSQNLKREVLVLRRRRTLNNPHA